MVIEKRDKSKIILSPEAKSSGVFIDISNKKPNKIPAKVVNNAASLSTIS
jgi:hypothetical protein